MADQDDQKPQKTAKNKPKLVLIPTAGKTKEEMVAELQTLVDQAKEDAGISESE